MDSRTQTEYTQPVQNNSPPAMIQEQTTMDARASACSEDIYCNTASPEEAAPSPPDNAKSRSVVKAPKSSLRVAKPQSIDGDTMVEAEGFYSSLDLSQKQERQDVYEAQMVIKRGEKPHNQVPFELEATDCQQDNGDEENVPAEKEERSPTDKAMLYLRSKKTILAAIVIFLLVFVASLLGSLVVGSVIIKNIEFIANNYLVAKNNENTITTNNTLTSSLNVTTE